jgi:hypothetical protein
LKSVKELRKKDGGKCLSKRYKNGKTKLLWECKDGHQWRATYEHIFNGKTWCPNCGGTKKHTLKEIKELAKKRNGKLLSKEYINNETKILWECHKKHSFYMTSADVGQGTWCPICAVDDRKKTWLEKYRRRQSS